MALAYGSSEVDGEPEENELEDEGDPFFWRLYDLVQKHRRRLAFAALVVFLCAVALEIGSAVPREVRLSYTFPDHGQVTEARIEYSQESESVREVRLRWPDGAPREISDRMEVSPGDYDVSVILIDRAGDTRRLRGRISTPADGVVQVRLHE